VASVLGEELPGRLGGTAPVHVNTVHPLPKGDARGIVPFYVAVGWIVTGYLVTALLGFTLGTRLDRSQVTWRLVSCGVLGLVVGAVGAALAQGIGDLGGPWLGLAAIGALIVFAVAAATLALQLALGPYGTGLAILIFVVYGNPASGGPFAYELLPGFWRVLGPYVPNGAAVTAIRDVSYFGAAPLWPALTVLLVWAAVGVAVALGIDRSPHGDPTVPSALPSAVLATTAP
jgi:hypothetical protein